MSIMYKISSPSTSRKRIQYIMHHYFVTHRIALLLGVATNNTITLCNSSLYKC